MIKKLSLIVVRVLSVSLVIGARHSVSLAAKEKGKPTATTSPAPSPTEQPSKVDTVNINKASAKELEKVSGIGPKTAEAIVKYREANGPFKTAEDLVKVKGIGASKFQKIKQQVTVE